MRSPAARSIMGCWTMLALLLLLVGSPAAAAAAAAAAVGALHAADALYLASSLPPPLPLCLPSCRYPPAMAAPEATPPGR